VTFLLDVNVMIALIDAMHVSHESAHAWFEREGRSRWATCPIVENGLVRIISNARYPNATKTPSEAVRLLAEFTKDSGHEFWPDDITIGDTLHIHRANLLSPGQVTDTYLLALSVSHGGQLATFDQRLTTLAVRDGARHLRVIEKSQ
jgi:toxin-antitoxin system PIN domain toxin